MICSFRLVRLYQSATFIQTTIWIKMAITSIILNYIQYNAYDYNNVHADRNNKKITTPSKKI